MLEEQDLQKIGELLRLNNQSLGKRLQDELRSANGTLREEFKNANNALRDDLRSEFMSAFETLKDEIVVEIGGAISEALTEIEAKIEKINEELAKRPTKEEIFSWADNRLVPLELARDRHDYLHINELDQLPPPAEISRALMARGFK